MGQRLSVSLVLLVAVAACSGCAIGHEKNRRVLNLLDAKVAESTVTESSRSRALWGVAFVPVGVAAAVVDSVIVNPIYAAPAAWRETHAAVWAEPPGDKVRQVLMYTPKLIATPIVCAGYWAFFCIFPVNYD